MRAVFVFVAASSLVVSLHAHLCILNPPQRGDLDVSSAGSHTCFRHGAQCGGEKAGTPVAHYIAGQTAFVKWQQNFNHYEVGHPGYMDIAIGSSENATEFHFLAAFGDINWHQQSHQQNYTVPVIIPNMECTTCVIRARYHAHKPGETVFYQCSDVTVKMAEHPNETRMHETKQVPKIGRWKETAHFIAKHNTEDRQIHGDSDVNALGSLYGLTCNPLESPKSCGFVRINPLTGIMSKIGPEHFGVDTAGLIPRDNDPGDYILDQIVAYAGSNLVYYLIHSGTVDESRQLVIAINTETGGVVHTYPLTIGEPVNALIMTGREVISFQIYPDTSKAGSYEFRWSKVDLESGSFTKLFSPAKSEDLYVNYQWSTYDSKNNIIYYLMGNENAAYDLTARLYAVSLEAEATEIEPVDINVANYTMGTVQYDERFDRLVALSPGLYTQGEPSWHMVRIDPKTGAVTPICQVAPAGLFKAEYTGGIFFGDKALSTFYARLRVLTEGPFQAEVFASITMSLDGCHVQFSPLGNFYHIHNMAYLRGHE